MSFSSAYLDPPLCSVVMPVFNAEAFLAESIDSVLSQTLASWELILVDDGSSDASVAIAEAFVARDNRIRLLRQAVNGGAARARNRAIAASRGRFIAFLDSDDVWLPAKLELQLAFMQQQGVAFSFTAYEKVDEQGRFVGRMGVPEQVGYSQLLKSCVIGCLTAVYDTQVLGRVLMPDVLKRQDFGLWLRLLKRVDVAYGLNVTLARYRLRPASLSANKATAALSTWRLYREVEQLGLLKSGYYFLHYAARGVLRSRFPVLARRLGVLH